MQSEESEQRGQNVPQVFSGISFRQPFVPQMFSGMLVWDNT